MAELENTILGEIQAKNPEVSYEVLSEASVHAYEILMDGRRFRDFYVDEPNKRQIKNLITNILNTPGYGVDLVPSYTYSIKEDYPTPSGLESRGRHLCGQVFCKEGKPYPADCTLGIRVLDIKRDFSYNDSMSEEEIRIKNANFWVDFQIVGDGATMLIDQKDWPEEVNRICLDVKSGKVLPDVFWRTSVEEILGISGSDSPFVGTIRDALGCSREASLKKVQDFISSKFEVYEYPSKLSNLVWEYVNTNLGELFKKVFKDFSYETGYKYPSGVFGALIVKGISPGDYPTRRPNFEQEKFLDSVSMAGVTVSGDVLVVADFKPVNDGEIVNNHDRLLDTLTGKRDRRIVSKISDLRRRLVGNAPNDNINKVSKDILRPRHIIMYTDGLKLGEKYCRNHSALYNGIVKFVPGADLTAMDIKKDLELTIISRRSQNRKTGQADDAGYGYWGAWEFLQKLAPDKRV